MKVYFVEVQFAVGERLEPIGLKSNFEAAYGLIGDRVGIITEMEVDKEYPEGIGICQHWHFGEDGPEQ